MTPTPGTDPLALLALLGSVLVALWPAWLLLALALLARAALSRHEKGRLLQSGIAEIDRANGVAFEAYLAALFGILGFRVARTPAGGDFGGDLILTRDGVRTVVQAKRYRGRVGVRAVQEVAAARGYYRARRALVVTNSTFTRAARTLARVNGIELWDRGRLIREILSMKPAGRGDPAARSLPGSKLGVFSLPDDSSEASPFTCARCAKPVSRGVARYCRAAPDRFHGQIYCRDHQ